MTFSLLVFALLVAGHPIQVPFSVHGSPVIAAPWPVAWIGFLVSLLPCAFLFWYRRRRQTDPEEDDVDEKYHDALDTTPLPPIHDLPPDDSVPNTSLPADLTLGSHPPDRPSADRSITSVSLPAWSLRAIDSPPLGLPSSTSQQLELIHPPPQRRAYRSPVPEFDLALAMQLRPGIGIGIAADSAWMVRFLMAIFGWFAVALTNNPPR